MVKVTQLGTNDVGVISIGKKKKGISNRKRTILLILFIIAGFACVYIGYQWQLQSNAQTQAELTNESGGNVSAVLAGVTIDINAAATPTPAPVATRPPMFSIP
jgi:hypothetical protein